VNRERFAPGGNPPLQLSERYVTLARMVMTRVVALFLLSVLLSGCASITNLTPRRQVRNSTGLYPIEAAWQTREQALKPETLKPLVMVGLESYPMQPTPVVTNRWETLIPVPADKKIVRYRFKFDYQYNAIPQPRMNSKMSPEYTLEIVDK
jgi:hypothetical protein